MIKIICDSTAYIPASYVKKHDITILPLTVTLNDEEFVDDDISRYDEFYEKVEKDDGRRHGGSMYAVVRFLSEWSYTPR